MRSVSASRILKALLVITVIAALQQGGDYCLYAGAGDTLIVVSGLEDAGSFSVTPSGTIYVLEPGRDRLAKYSPSGRFEAETGGYGWDEGGFDLPSDVAAIDDLELFVADRGNDRIVRLDRTLALTSVFDTRSKSVTFRYPLSVALTEFGKLLIVDGENARIVELGKDDRVTRVFGGIGTGKSFLRKPSRVRTDGNARVVVRDGSNLSVFDTYGNHLRTIPADRTGSFTAFDIGSGGITLLDSNAVRFLSAEGVMISRTEIPGTHGRQPPVDVRTVGSSVFVLFPDRIIRFPAGIGERTEPSTGRKPD